MIVFLAEMPIFAPSASKFTCQEISFKQIVLHNLK